MAVEVPEPLQWVLLLLSGARWPEADEDNLRQMAEHWRSVASALDDIGETSDATMRRALADQQGVAATKLTEYWANFTTGKGEEQPGVFPGLVAACNGMGDMLESMANSAETAKIQIIAQLGILAVDIATAEVEAPFTAGVSLAQIPVAVAAIRTVVQQIIKKLALEALEFAAKQAVQMAAINLLAQSIEVMQGHRKSVDLNEVGQNAASGAVAGASGNLLGKGVGAAGAKAGLGRVMGTLPGRMVTAGAVGVGADVITQAVTTGKVDSHSLLGSGLSGATGAGLHAGGAALNEHFRPPAEAPHAGVPTGAEVQPGAGEHGAAVPRSAEGTGAAAGSDGPAPASGATHPGADGSAHPVTSDHTSTGAAAPAGEAGSPAQPMSRGIGDGAAPAAGAAPGHVETSPAFEGPMHAPAAETGHPAPHSAVDSGAPLTTGEPGTAGGHGVPAASGLHVADAPSPHLPPAETPMAAHDAPAPIRLGPHAADVPSPHLPPTETPSEVHETPVPINLGPHAADVRSPNLAHTEVAAVAQPETIGQGPSASVHRGSPAEAPNLTPGPGDASRTATERPAGQTQPTRGLHEHPSGPALVYPIQQSAVQKALFKAKNLVRPDVPAAVHELKELMPQQSSGGKYLHPESGTGRPFEGIHLNTRTNTLKTDHDPTTLNDLSSQVVRTVRNDTDAALTRWAPDKVSGSGQERIEAAARLDYRTADYWKGQDARREQLDVIVAANTASSPAGLSPESLHRVDTALHDAPDAVTGAGRILAQHQGFVLGEVHSASTSWPFLKENMTALREHGVRTVYLEALRDDSFQHHLDTHLRSPEGSAMPPELDTMISRYDSSHGSLPGNGLREVVEAAKAEGVDIRAVDGRPARREAGEWGLYERAARFNTYAADAVAGDGKYVMVVGKAHVHPHPAPDGATPVSPIHSELPAPGLSQLLRVPGLELQDGPGGSVLRHMRPPAAEPVAPAGAGQP
ncbi:WXG100-like domain-containing protein [Kitasatospora sp. NPDC001175]|uniref:WXG100-like domain-containing protein n=1 Tax=Kitasatospora sp. NPDC001175 TaxID=3157103 RepID=UPI003CFE8642